MAAHGSLRTTKLYDCTGDEITTLDTFTIHFLLVNRRRVRDGCGRLQEVVSGAAAGVLTPITMLTSSAP
jgi:hypothetical protein